MTVLLSTAASPIADGVQVHGSATTVGSVSPSTLWDVVPGAVRPEVTWDGLGRMRGPFSAGWDVYYTPFMTEPLSNGFQIRLGYESFYGEPVGVFVAGWDAIDIVDVMRVYDVGAGEIVLRIVFGSTEMQVPAGVTGDIMVRAEGETVSAWIDGHQETTTVSVATPSPQRILEEVGVYFLESFSFTILGPLLIETVDAPGSTAFWTEFVNSYEIP